MAFAHMLRTYRRAQSFVDYVLIVGIVAAALIAMGTYMRRGVQAGVKAASDELGSQEGIVTDTKVYSEEHSIMQSSPAVQRTLSTGAGGTRTIQYNDATTTDGVVDSYTEREID